MSKGIYNKEFYDSTSKRTKNIISGRRILFEQCLFYIEIVYGYLLWFMVGEQSELDIKVYTLIRFSFAGVERRKVVTTSV